MELGSLKAPRVNLSKQSSLESHRLSTSLETARRQLHQPWVLLFVLSGGAKFVAVGGNFLL